MKNIAVILDAHKIDELTFLQFQILSEALEPEISVFLVVHLPDGNFLIDNRIIILNDEEIFARQPPVKHGAKRIIPGNPDMKILRAVQLLPDFDGYLRIEFDVMCMAPVKEIVTRLLNRVDAYDFAATQMATRAVYGSWVWWDTLRVPDEVSSRINSENTWKAFLPLFFFSKRFIAGYEKALAEGWTGHYEVTMPTYAALSGMKMLDFERAWQGITDSKNFRHDKLKCPEKITTDFVHPVKTLSEFMRLKGFDSFMKEEK